MKGKVAWAEENWLCRECKDVFSANVSHCLHCDSHYPRKRGLCGNCHNKLGNMPRSDRISPELAKRIVESRLNASKWKFGRTMAKLKRRGIETAEDFYSYFVKKARKLEKTRNRFIESRRKK